ncbi:hypothetical protein HMI56_005291 [Coelomomyces lativittatus]|nr:hypothetical protein HMI56_005291 [Coelomomyces lativittatus]
MSPSPYVPATLQSELLSTAPKRAPNMPPPLFLVQKQQQKLILNSAIPTHQVPQHLPNLFLIPKIALSHWPTQQDIEFHAVTK